MTFSIQFNDFIRKCIYIYIYPTELTIALICRYCARFRSAFSTYLHKILSSFYLLTYQFDISDVNDAWLARATRVVTCLAWDPPEDSVRWRSTFGSTSWCPHWFTIFVSIMPPHSSVTRYSQHSKLPSRERRLLLVEVDARLKRTRCARGTAEEAAVDGYQRCDESNGADSWPTDGHRGLFYRK